MSKSTRMLAAGAALLLVLGLGPSASAPPTREAERGVRRALMRLNALLAERDMALVDEFLDSDDVLLVGSEMGEVARGREGVSAHFKEIFGRRRTLSFSWREVEVSVHGAVAFLHAEGEAVLTDAKGKAERRPYRLTGVFELHRGLWKWRLFHGSEPQQG
jgi:ketosteroid isomerase-like protein